MNDEIYLEIYLSDKLVVKVGSPSAADYFADNWMNRLKHDLRTFPKSGEINLLYKCLVGGYAEGFRDGVNAGLEAQPWEPKETQ
jgi:hypothetical protein